MSKIHRRWNHLPRAKRRHLLRLIGIGVIATVLAIAVDHKLAELFAASAMDAVFEGFINASE